MSLSFSLSSKAAQKEWTDAINNNVNFINVQRGGDNILESALSPLNDVSWWPAFLTSIEKNTVIRRKLERDSRFSKLREQAGAEKIIRCLENCLDILVQQSPFMGDILKYTSTFAEKHNLPHTTQTFFPSLDDMEEEAQIQDYERCFAEFLVNAFNVLSHERVGTCHGKLEGHKSFIIDYFAKFFKIKSSSQPLRLHKLYWEEARAHFEISSSTSTHNKLYFNHMHAKEKEAAAVLARATDETQKHFYHFIPLIVYLGCAVWYAVDLFYNQRPLPWKYSDDSLFRVDAQNAQAQSHSVLSYLSYLNPYSWLETDRGQEVLGRLSQHVSQAEFLHKIVLFYSFLFSLPRILFKLWKPDRIQHHWASSVLHLNQAFPFLMSYNSNMQHWQGKWYAIARNRDLTDPAKLPEYNNISSEISQYKEQMLCFMVVPCIIDMIYSFLALVFSFSNHGKKQNHSSSDSSSSSRFTLSALVDKAIFRIAPCWCQIYLCILMWWYGTPFPEGSPFYDISTWATTNFSLILDKVDVSSVKSTLSVRKMHALQWCVSIRNTFSDLWNKIMIASPSGSSSAKTPRAKGSGGANTSSKPGGKASDPLHPPPPFSSTTDSPTKNGASEDILFKSWTPEQWAQWNSLKDAEKAAFRVDDESIQILNYCVKHNILNKPGCIEMINNKELARQELARESEVEERLETSEMKKSLYRDAESKVYLGIAALFIWPPAAIAVAGVAVTELAYAHAL